MAEGFPFSIFAYQTKKFAFQCPLTLKKVKERKKRDVKIKVRKKRKKERKNERMNEVKKERKITHALKKESNK